MCRTSTGIGLGLLMAQNIAHQIGSEKGITFSSCIGMGSTFTFEIINQQSNEIPDSKNPISEENAVSDIILVEKLDKYQTKKIPSWKDRQDNFKCQCNRIMVVDDVGTNIFAI